jgi:hypothetical protein
VSLQLTTNYPAEKQQKMSTEPSSAAVTDAQETGELNSDLDVLALQQSHAATVMVIC